MSCFSLIPSHANPSIIQNHLFINAILLPHTNLTVFLAMIVPIYFPLPPSCQLSTENAHKAMMSWKLWLLYLSVCAVGVVCRSVEVDYDDLTTNFIHWSRPLVYNIWQLTFTKYCIRILAIHCMWCSAQSSAAWRNLHEQRQKIELIVSAVIDQCMCLAAPSCSTVTVLILMTRSASRQGQKVTHAMPCIHLKKWNRWASVHVQWLHGDLLAYHPVPMAPHVSLSVFSPPSDAASSSE